MSVEGLFGNYYDVLTKCQLKLNNDRSIAPLPTEIEFLLLGQHRPHLGPRELREIVVVQGEHTWGNEIYCLGGTYNGEHNDENHRDRSLL